MNSISTKTIIIVLGSPNAPDGELYSLALERSAKAVELYRQMADAKVLLTGGFGPHFNTSTQPHAHHLKQHLLGHGIPNDAFLPFAESRNTVEDAALSKPIVLAHAPQKLIVVTSDFHHDRAKYIFEREFTASTIPITMALAATDEEQCQFDLAPLREHEKRALAKLIAADQNK